MAIDFSQVKKIMIPEGEVTKIQINGVTVWENAPVLTSITLSGQTTSLNRGAAFSFGGTVTAHYSNGSTANVTSATTFTGYNMAIGGTYTVTAHYTENNITKTATYQLTVNKAWATLWSGTRALYADKSSQTGGWANFKTTVEGTGYTPQLRITYNTLDVYKSGDSSYLGQAWKNNSKVNTNTISSPITITLSNVTTNNVFGAVLHKSGISLDAKLTSTKDTTNNNLELSFVASKTGSPSGAQYAKITITKIEQYY